MMMTNNLFKQHKPWGNTLALAAGLTAVAGIAVIYAIPRTRRSVSKWINDTVDDLKERMNFNKGNSDWQQDMVRSEALKGPLKKRRNPVKVEVPSAGTSAWKDEWHSE